MADDLLDRLNARAGAPSDTPASGDIGAMLEARAAGAKTVDTAPAPKPVVPLSAGKRFTQGITDLPVGLGQLAQHVAPMDYIRTGVRGIFHAAGDLFGAQKNELADSINNVSTKDFDNVVATREQDYQKARADAQQHGIDWWRIGGEASNPLNYAAPGGAAASVTGRIGQAAVQGAALGAAAPSITPGNFGADKLKGAGIGGLTGAVGGSLVEAAMPALRWGANAARKLFSSGEEAVGGAAPAAADTVVNETLKAAGVDPKTVDINVVKGMRQEVDEAVKAGVAPSADVIKNRAVAESLPVPINLMRGQAGRDPFLYAKELNQRGWENVGEPIADRLTQQNRGLIENLNTMGAKNAPDPVTMGQAIGDHIRTIDEGLKGKISDAYDAVKNSAGQPAAMDGKAFASSLRSNLDEDFRFLPAEVRGTVEDLESGKLPLTVKRAQSLDKAWTGLQSGAPISDTSDRAIEIAKKSLLDAPLSDSVGADSIAAYKAAKSLAKGRFDAIDANPVYKAVIRGQKSAEPDQLFNRFVMGGTSREVGSLKQFLGQVDPAAPESLGRTLLGEIKRQSINGSEESGAFSQAKFGKFVTDPVWQSRLKTLLPPDAVDSLGRLNHVAELIQRAPVASAVNRSSTTSAAFNAAQDVIKAGGMEKLSNLFSKIPGASTAAQATAAGLKTGRLEKAVGESLNPGVTLKALPRLNADQVAALRAASTGLTGLTVATQDQRE